MIKVLGRGIPFYKTQGFPKLSPCYVTIWEFPLQNVCYNCSKYFLDISSFCSHESTPWRA